MNSQTHNQKKILCITNDFGPRAGGIESFVIGLIERMPKDSVIVLTSAQEGSVPFDALWLDKFGVEVIRAHNRILLPTFLIARKAQAIVRQRSITTVFFGAAAPLALLSQGLRRSGVTRIVALTHGHEVWWSKLWPFSWMMRRIGNGVDHLTYLGEFTRRNIAPSLSKHAQESMVKIAPGIDIDHFSPRSDSVQLRADLGLLDKKVIVSVGRLVHRKGQDTLIEALPEILTKIPQAHILFLGDGPYKDFLLKRVSALGLTDHISFVGRVQFSDLPTYICVGDIFAMPSRSRLAGLEVEGLGIVYLEASACGLAVISGLSGGAPDAIIEGETGFAVDGTSPMAVAGAAITLLSQPDLASRMGIRGRAWVLEQWRWEIWSARFNQLLQ
jgi:phosphatidylinositol alpha-1,6-mannosyltransferase